MKAHISPGKRCGCEKILVKSALRAHLGFIGPCVSLVLIVSGVCSCGCDGADIDFDTRVKRQTKATAPFTGSQPSYQQNSEASCKSLKQLKEIPSHKGSDEEHSEMCNREMLRIYLGGSRSGSQRGRQS